MYDSMKAEYKMPRSIDIDAGGWYGKGSPRRRVVKQNVRPVKPAPKINRDYWYYAAMVDGIRIFDGAFSSEEEARNFALQKTSDPNPIIFKSKSSQLAKAKQQFRHRGLDNSEPMGMVLRPFRSPDTLQKYENGQWNR